MRFAAEDTERRPAGVRWQSREGAGHFSDPEGNTALRSDLYLATERDNAVTPLQPAPRGPHGDVANGARTIERADQTDEGGRRQGLSLRHAKRMT